MQFKVFFFFFWGCFFALNQVSAQILPALGGSRSGTTGMQFLKIAPDARSAGLAGSMVAIANDVSSLYWNPAGISRIDTNRFHFQAGHTAYFADYAMNYVGSVVKVKDSYIGLSIINLNSGDIPVTTEFQPFGTGEVFRSNSFTLGLSYAKSLTDNFSFGVTGKYARESIAGVNINNALLDFGFLYDIGLYNTRFAVSLSNFGVNVQPDGSIQVLKLNGTFDENNFETVSVPAIFRIGFAWDAIKTDLHMLTLTTQLNHPTDNNETITLAGEYLWNNILYVRTGYEFGTVEKGIPALGTGLHFKRNFGILRLDYGFNNKERLGSIHRATIGLTLFK